MNEKLSILLLNQTWFATELREFGHRVVTAGVRDSSFDIVLRKPGFHITEIFSKLPRGFIPDRIVYHDDSRSFTVIGLEEANIPKVFFSVDAHHHWAWHRHFAVAFDLVLVAQKDYVGYFKEINYNSYWFPLWSPVEMSPAKERSMNISFRGNLDLELHPKRAHFFEKIAKEIPLTDFKMGTYTDIYPHSKIVLNQAVKDDVNFRVYEGMMAGALMITPQTTNGLEDLFKPGVDLVTYKDGDVEDALEKVRYYLANDLERELIAFSGREKVVVKHSAKARAKDLEQHLLSLKVIENKPQNLNIGITYLMLANRASIQNQNNADRLLHLSTKALSRSFQLNEAQVDQLEVAILYCKYWLESRGFFDQALEAISNVAETNLSNIFLAIGYLDSLIQNNMLDRAKIVAAQISDKPEELLEQLPNINKELKAGVLAVGGIKIDS